MKLVHIVIVYCLLSITGCRSQVTHQDIVLINSGLYDKGQLAKVLEKLNLLSPRVVAVDIAFREYNASEADKRLSLALKNCRHLVMPSVIEDIDENRIYFALASRGEFSPIFSESGFVNELNDGTNNVPKSFTVWKEDFNGDRGYHFSIKVAESFDSLKVVKYINSHTQREIIDFGNRPRLFKTFLSTEVLSEKVARSDIEGKIVMIGFLGPGDEDKFVSPFNSDGKKPDMYGLEYLAYIVAQILE